MFEDCYLNIYAINNKIKSEIFAVVLVYAKSLACPYMDNGDL